VTDRDGNPVGGETRIGINADKVEHPGRVPPVQIEDTDVLGFPLIRFPREKCEPLLDIRPHSQGSDFKAILLSGIIFLLIFTIVEGILQWNR
jgi:hypothetical protein